MGRALTPRFRDSPHPVEAGPGWKRIPTKETELWEYPCFTYAFAPGGSGPDAPEDVRRAWADCVKIREEHARIEKALGVSPLRQALTGASAIRQAAEAAGGSAVARAAAASSTFQKLLMPSAAFRAFQRQAAEVARVAAVAPRLCLRLPTRTASRHSATSYRRAPRRQRSVVQRVAGTSASRADPPDGDPDPPPLDRPSVPRWLLQRVGTRRANASRARAPPLSGNVGFVRHSCIWAPE
jgi:hypothetical protein